MGMMQAIPEPVRGECNALSFVAGLAGIPEHVNWVRCVLSPDHKLNKIDTHMAIVPLPFPDKETCVLWKDEQ
jgi:hypothetical protein